MRAKKKTGVKRNVSAKRKWPRLLIGVIAIVVAVSLAVLLLKTGEPPPTSATDGQSVVDYSSLIGRWVRPDGGYVLEVRNISGDLSVDAGYFNPNPIHVARAELYTRKGVANLVIELRDVGYPGALYHLEYVSAQNVLRGSYYQPAYGQTFDVVFERMP